MAQVAAALRERSADGKNLDKSDNPQGSLTRARAATLMCCCGCLREEPSETIIRWAQA